jgi:hypothetical protein
VSRLGRRYPLEEREKWDRIAARDKERFEMEKAMYKVPGFPFPSNPQKDPDAPSGPCLFFVVLKL